MISPLAKKLGIKPGMDALILAPPPGYLKSLAPLPEGAVVSADADGAHRFVQVFATNLSELAKIAQTFAKHAACNALIWIAYPKKTAASSGNLSRDVLREAMLPKGWRTVSIVAIDETWSALRFRPATQPKSGAKASSGSPAN